LVLPKGGSREDLVVTDALYDYISAYALEWFQSSDSYLKDCLTVEIPNGNLYLVTGVDRVPEWSALSFWRQDEFADEESITIGYDSAGSEPWNIPSSETYTARNNFAVEEWHEGRLATAFVRGLRIALSPPTWEGYLPTDVIAAIYKVPLTTLTGTSSLIPPSFLQSLPAIHMDLTLREVRIYPC